MLVGLLLCLSGTLSAQNLESYKRTLAVPQLDTLSLRSATVEVYEEPKAAEALRSVESSRSPQRFQGWRICIFSDNTAEAREGARKAMESFEQQFPTIPLYDQYASPYFRVSVGNCTTPEEAIILLERVRPLFPKAFMKQEQLRLDDLLEEERLKQQWQERQEALQLQAEQEAAAQGEESN